MWLPNAGIFLVGSLLLAVYYPRYQASLFEEQKDKELTEMARSVANGIELSLDAGNFKGLEKTMRSFAADKKSISILVVAASEDPKQATGELMASFPAGLDHHRLLTDSARFIQVRSPFKTELYGGSVYILEPVEQLEAMVWEINAPVYAILGIVFLISMLIFYFVARRVSTPIRELNRYAVSLITVDSVREDRIRSGNELNRLRESLYSLKKSADIEHQRNLELTRSLETEVQSRTFELSRKNTYLEHAAKILRHDMHSGINTYLPRGINSLIRRLKPEVIEENSLDAPIRLIKEGLAHTQKVYQGIYEFTNLVKPGSKLNLEERDLREILVAFLSTTSYKDQVEIKDLGKAMVSESLFCTAVDNLIRNGLKYNDEPTKVVRISRLEGDVIEVLDNGRGLSQEEFEKFSSTGTRREGQAEAGSGLGLSICVAILQEHGFRITSERVQPVGSSIKIKLT